MPHKLPISFCYIVKNEEQLLAKSLISIRDIASEIVVVDTGSTDRSLEIANEFTSKISHFDWIDDFAAARNYAAALANEEWIFMIDADEVLERTCFNHLETAVSQSDFSAFHTIQRNYTNNVYTTGWSPRSAADMPWTYEAASFRGFYDIVKPCLYQNDSRIQWEGAVHETIIPCVEKLNLRHSTLQIAVHHLEFMKEAGEKSAKTDLYLKLGMEKLRNNPHDQNAWYELGHTFLERGEDSRAEQAFSKALQIRPDWPEVELIFARLILNHERFAEAEKMLRKLRFRYTSPIEVHAQLSTALLYQKKLSEALEMAQIALELDSSCFVANLNSGIILYEHGDAERALLFFRRAHHSNPEDPFVKGAIARIEREVLGTGPDSARRQNH